MSDGPENPNKVLPKNMKTVVALCLMGSLFSSEANVFDKKDLVGTWRLQSYTLVEDGVERPWCKNPFGLISYYSNGYMAVGINCKKSEGNDEMTSDSKDMVFYTGKFSIKQPHTVVHHVENSNDVSRIGKSLEREAILRGNRVTLTGLGVKGPVRLVWEKTK